MGRKDRRQHKDASPTERALSELRHRGLYVVPCEAWKPAGGFCPICRTASFWRRSDFAGFADLVALPDLLAIQVTSAKNHSTRLRKIIHERAEAAWWWMAAGGTIEVWSWRLNSSDEWTFRSTEVTVDDLINAGYQPPDQQQELSL